MTIRPYIHINKEVNTTSNNKTYINMNNKNDECYTRQVEADDLINYLVRNKIIQKKKKIWLPFNDLDGAIYKALKKKVLKI